MISRSSFLLLLALTLSALPAAAQPPGVSDTEIVIGGSNSFSGPLAFTGEQITRFGVDLYFKVINDAGGIHGRKIRTVYYDDAYRPQEAVANTNKLVEQDKIFAIIIPQGSPPVVATLDYLEENNVPLLFPYQSSPVTRGKRYVMQGMTLSDRSSKMMIDYLVGQRKFKKFAALYQDDEYGKSFLTAFEKDLGAPRPEAGRRRIRQARRHRRECPDREAPGRDARGDLPRADAGPGRAGPEGAPEDRLDRHDHGLDGPADGRELPGPRRGRRRGRRGAVPLARSGEPPICPA